MSKTSKTDWERLAKLDDADIDTSDIPELDEDFFRRAELRVPVKQAVTIRLDADVVEWFKGQGAGYQTRINQLLRLILPPLHQRFRYLTLQAARCRDHTFAVLGQHLVVDTWLVIHALRISDRRQLRNIEVPLIALSQ